MAGGQTRDEFAISRRLPALRLVTAGVLVVGCFGWRTGTASGLALTVSPPLAGYVPVQPERFLETRAAVGQKGYSGGKPAAGQTVTLKVTATGTTNVPVTASAVVLNVTGTGASADGFVTVWPCDQTQPTASNLNLTTGGTAPNLVIAKISAAGTVCLFTQSGTDLIADINGYFPAGSSYVAVQPERFLETRAAVGQKGYIGGKPAAGQTVTLKVTATGTTNVPVTASAVVLNVTGTGASGDGFVTVWPCDQTQPTASNLNLTTGGTAPNLVIAKISATGTVCLFTQSGTDLIADINGYFPDGPPTGDFVVGGSRPVTVHTPANYNPATPAPLLIMLHGYAANGAVQESYLQLAATASADGILYAYPDGTTDTAGNRFWNATDACCDLFHSGVDDSAYIAGLIAAIKSKVAIDPKRVFIVGHSNGGFMAYRLACDHSTDIAAIVSIAGATFNTPSACAPAAPVSVLQVHGTNDSAISYTGGTSNGAIYPSAADTVKIWAAYDGCSQTADSPNPPSHTITTGSAATVTAYSTGCIGGSHAELWTLPGGQHIPTLLHPDFETQIIAYLLAHPKP